MTAVTVHASKEYDVIIGEGILSTLGERCASILGKGRAVIITDSNVAPLWLGEAKASLEKAGIDTVEFTFPAGEDSKSSATLTELVEFMAENRLTRSDFAVALGGGVTGDMVGLASSLYLRGIEFVQVPTTLLAAVDSSVGGKTAVNLKAGKNLCGAFYQPIAVYADCETLNTLPPETFNEGCAEIIKYGMILDEEFLTFLKNNNIRENIEYVIKRCVEIKRDVVDRDEFENGERKLLNFGHTIGHAIEKCSHLTISHGNAVAIGMVIATRGAYKMGLVNEDFTEMLVEILIANGLPVTCNFTAEELYKISLSDKKRSLDTISLIIPEKYGFCKIEKISVDNLKEFIEAGLN